MPRHCCATDNPSDNYLTMSKACLAAICFVVVLLVGKFTSKMLTWKGDKRNQTAMRFGAGVTLGTAMMDLIIESDAIFYNCRFRYPMAFLMFCVGYVVAMLADSLLARWVRRLPRESFNNPRSECLDVIMFALDLESTLPLVTTNSETKDAGEAGVDNYDPSNLFLYRARLLVDGLIILYIFCCLSAIHIWDTRRVDTKAMASTVLQNIIYVVSLVFTSKSVNPAAVRHLIIVFAVVVQGSIVAVWILDYAGFMLGGGPTHALVGGVFSYVVGACDGVACEWFLGLYLGCIAGVLVYIAVNHMLVGGNSYNEFERPVSDDCFGKSVAVAFGVGAIALLKVLQM